MNDDPIHCYHCGPTERPVMTPEKLKPKTLIQARAVGVIFPSCTKCFNAQYSGAPIKKDEDTALPTLRSAVNLLRMTIGNRFKRGGIPEGRKMVEEMNSHWKTFDLIWRTVTIDLDSLSELPATARRARMIRIRKRIIKLNGVHSDLLWTRELLALRVAIDYKESKRESNNLLRKEWFRSSILAAAGFKCCACGSSDELEIDHIVPVIRGGETEKENLQALCATCNAKKGSKKVDATSKGVLKTPCNRVAAT